MPTLHWIGKEKVINHHQDVPYRILDKQYTFNNDEGSSENKIIHGDNLEALKSLLPEYEGKIKCIYIDPPYNTGNEGWVYNDNVNDPKIKKWLHEVVGKEGEDLSRHDKWLCMMYPRIKLLSKLLNDDGAIFISIDDMEVHYLCLILDEIFGKPNFVANVVWQKRTSPDDRATIGAGHEHIIIYSKKWENFRRNLNKLPLTKKQTASFKNPDNDPRGAWVSSDFTAQGFRPNQMYEITTPSGKKYSPPESRCWKNIESVFLKAHEEGRMWYGKNGDGVPRRKTYLAEREGVASWTWWTNEEVGHNQEGKQEINSIFDSASLFDTPKPSRLIERILHLYVNPGEIILDSFAGSGTTAHAVLNLNKADGGNRKFILIEMEEYADTITAERVKRVINGYGENSKAVEGTGGNFSYYTLGETVFLEDGFLNENIGIDKINEYVWFTETRTKYEPQTEPYLLGKKEGTAYYFFYDKDSGTTLDESFLRKVKTKADQYIIYADNCLLDEALMQKYHIVFKKIPRDITRF
ncbi:site-specific DNA-methyltransferase (adenine-specific) [Flavobacterium longum]|uniref:site-specific DNA-methyltransferase n=1 Tax=Flavobacterium longum TaxID=1299340 RepID=UPI0039EA26A5